tara:strand:- start:8906 stop:9112 length:207 start_codon:yes stop_codon:yes gene_type:complete
MLKEKYLITKSNDDCVVIVRADKKTDKGDIFISDDTFKRNIEEKTFCKHPSLTHNNKPIYIYHEDLSL